MIALLKGILEFKAADRIILDVDGVGYEVFIPFSTYYELGDQGSKITLNIYTHVAENSLALYGFRTDKEKKLFMQLIQISGIGPRLGVTILSGLPVTDFIEAVNRGDIARLSTIPGVGKKTSERIALEMRDKIVTIFPEGEEPDKARFSNVQKDVVSALVNLGYPRNRAESAVSASSEEESSDHFEVLLKLALKKISR